MAGAQVGFFGKLPSHGDFIERRIEAAFRDVWDEWLQRCIADSQQQLGAGWLDCYLTSPMWRFFLSDGIAGTASYAGVLLPSVDRVGRYFPLSVVVALPAAIAPVEFAGAAAPWFGAVEVLCAEALQSESLDLEAFDRELLASGELLGSVDHLSSPRSFPGTSSHWHWPLASIDTLAAALGAPLTCAAQSALRPLTMWWTQGSERVSPSVLLVRALPQSDRFGALLDGRWQDGGWDGETEAAAAPDVLNAGASFSLASGGATDPGTVRSQNQDNFLLNDANRLWAVADGMGGHSHGEVASQMVVDALNNLEPTATLNSALQTVAVALSRVNTDLQRGALFAGQPERSGSTVVVLLIRGAEWAVSWAGDSRAYRLRGGVLTQLTRDHAPDGADNAAREISRAVGGDEALQLDSVADLLCDGDRFLLCSDGLYTAVDPATVLSKVSHLRPEAASRALIEAACVAGARDNVTAVIIDAGGQGP